MVSWRNPVLACLLVLYLGLPVRCAMPEDDPWHYLEKGLAPLAVENILYRGYYFVPETNWKRVNPAGMGNGSGEAPGGRWFAGDGGDGYTVLRVEGTDGETCRFLLGKLKAAVGCARCAAAWNVEAYAPGGPGELAEMGLVLVERLGGRVHSVAGYNGTVHILAHVPWAAAELLLEDGPVNLNLELYHDPDTAQTRIRAGVPVLLSLP